MVLSGGNRRKYRFSPVPLTVEEIAEKGEKGFILTDQKGFLFMLSVGQETASLLTLLTGLRA
jgi:hypothetical protein